MKSDAQLKQDVMDELEWNPAINAKNVGVIVKDGIVTLTGHLDTFAEKTAIDNVVRSLEGVKAVAIELDVKLAAAHKRSDTEIAQAIESAFKWNSGIPADRINVRVEKGAVTLTGSVNWNYQRVAVANAVQATIGVTTVINNISLNEHPAPKNVTSLIRAALVRQAENDAKDIEVMATGGTVILRGKVHSWAEATAAAQASWNAPGVAKVLNELVVAD